MDSGDACTQCMNLTPLKCTLKNGGYGQFYAMFILSQLRKKMAGCSGSFL
jgi:hypothetical protein